MTGAVGCTSCDLATQTEAAPSVTVCISAALMQFPLFWLESPLVKKSLFSLLFPKDQVCTFLLGVQILSNLTSDYFPHLPFHNYSILTFPHILNCSKIYFPNNCTPEPLFRKRGRHNARIGLKRKKKVTMLENRGNCCVILDKLLVISGPLSHLQNILKYIMLSKFLSSSYIPWRAEPVPELNLISLFLFWSHCIWNLSFCLKVHCDIL